MHHQKLTAGQLSGGVNAGIVPREADEDRTALLLVDDRPDVGLDVVEAHGCC
jgi:hypothetical protein